MVYNIYILLKFGLMIVQEYFLFKSSMSFISSEVSSSIVIFPSCTDSKSILYKQQGFNLSLNTSYFFRWHFNFHQTSNNFRSTEFDLYFFPIFRVLVMNLIAMYTNIVRITAALGSVSKVL